jgi:hypothetical protein
MIIGGRAFVTYVMGQTCCLAMAAPVSKRQVLRLAGLRYTDLDSMDPHGPLNHECAQALAKPAIL